MKTGVLSYNFEVRRFCLYETEEGRMVYPGFHCGETLEVFVDDEWKPTRFEMNSEGKWCLVNMPYTEIEIEGMRARTNL